ncbi:MAG: TAT-variant-translocated molybdopterin oxidoreductase [Lentisphaeria bacterium]|nr:TAT-variant-translocated molybdopterin oxidoreductase [Lentisphaeria bacterium]NQZ66729.1 TAT-variant-translocated molybdopterin oxidoreductase [Lentisphaeria bacterium]
MNKRYYRSNDQLEETPQFQEFLDREFPYLNDGLDQLGMSRRGFLSLMGASIAMTGLTGCRRPVENILPYAKQPEQIIPGNDLYYASSFPFGEENIGIVVESHEGRPTKIDGNKLHPASTGSSSAFMQASILDLYDPDRIGILTAKEKEGRNPNAKDVQGTAWLDQKRKTLADFTAAYKTLHETFSKNQGEGLVVISTAIASPTLNRLALEFEEAFPKAKWATWEAVNNEALYSSIEKASGEELRPIYHFDKSMVTVSFDSDFMLTETDSIRNAKNYAKNRKYADKTSALSRLYVTETAYTCTGAMADHRVAVKASMIKEILNGVIKELRKKGLKIGVDVSAVLPSGVEETVKAMANDLFDHKGKSLVVAGRRQSKDVHALVLALNNALGNIGKTVDYVEISHSRLSNSESLKIALTGKADTVVILGGNPVYDAPVDFTIKETLEKAKHVIRLGYYFDESSSAAEWHIPESHYLEAWSDAVSIDGTQSVIQPLIQPLYGTISKIEMLSLLISGELHEKSAGFGEVKKTWDNIVSSDRQFKQVLHDGLLSGTAGKAKKLSINDSAIEALYKSRTRTKVGGLEMTFSVSPAVYDGRYSNNGWLQEMPDPVSKLTWDNAILMNPETAKKHGFRTILGEQKGNNEGRGNADLATVRYDGREVTAPVLAMPGHAKDCMTLELGFGRNDFKGRIGGLSDEEFRKAKPTDKLMGYNPEYRTQAPGANAYALKGTEEYGPVTITATNDTYLLAITQDHHSMEMRALVREANLNDYKAGHPLEPIAHAAPHTANIWGEQHTYNTGYQWGMAIDLSTCIGCNACVIACQSENNIPIVGKEQVSRARELHWIRIDRYFSDSLIPNDKHKDVFNFTGNEKRENAHAYDAIVDEEPQLVFQPVPCQHCEMAPCEQVCPVAATTHDEEGLNVMVYNRCIGTRYCSDNCPYKVRRFNYFNFTKDTVESQKMGNNPDVTIRFRGVMEKCTYCVQRISAGRIHAKVEGRKIKTNEIITACQQACPVEAISFGDINNPDSQVVKEKALDRNYNILEDLNTRPRTSYLGRIRNPNTHLIADKKEAPPHHGSGHEETGHGAEKEHSDKAGHGAEKEHAHEDEKKGH